MKNVCFVILGSLLTIAAFGQKGLPEKMPTAANVHTFYAAHLDFKENMVSDIMVPPGFNVSVVATGLGKPRMMYLNDKGELYITRRDQGDVLKLKDTDGDGKFDELKTVWSGFKEVHGITIHNGMMYLCSNKELKQAKIMDDGMLTDTITLISDLPEGSQHDNRYISFGPDGMMYISVGSSCNDCKETNPENATILQVMPDLTSRKIYARGLRNTIGFDWHPATKEMWGCDNGTDWRGDSIPPEELNRIEKDGNYGWPQVFGKQQTDLTREDPPGTTKEAYAKTTKPAILTFPAHSAPIDFRFMTNATAFPQEYKHDALVCWHGSWNRLNPEGFKVSRIKYNNGNPVGMEDFFSGFLSKDGKTRFGRPAGLAISAKGVYISDDENGVIYFVSHK